MTSDWRTKLQKEPRVIELQRSMWAKWRVLARDKEFVLQTPKLKTRLERALAINAEVVKQFFRFYSLPTGKRLPKIQAYLRRIKEEEVRAALRHYIEYVARFGVMMYRRDKKPYFRTQALPSWGTKFHAKILRGHLRPVSEAGPYIYQFEDDNVDVPAPLEKLTKTGKAKLVRIDDIDGSSVLTEVEAFAYHAEGLTFILHIAELPYIVCLIGEKTSGKTWRAAERTVHALQRQYYGRVNAGKPPDIRQILKVSAAQRKAGSSKEKAIKLGKTANTWSSQSDFSRIKRSVT